MRKIIITGTSRGIGLELVKIFADSGHQVLALSRKIEPVQVLKHENIFYFPFDITQESDFEKLSDFILEHWKTVDIVINNAGKLINKPFEHLTPNDFFEVFDVNLFGVARLIQKVLPFMSQGGHVLNISSMGGVQGSMKFAGLGAYSSSKGALITLTELLAEEYKERGVAFNVLALGAVQTEMLQEAFPGYQTTVSAKAMATYIANFAQTGQHLFNGKIIQVSNSTP